MITVQDGTRNLEFDGVELSRSSSEFDEENKTRWIEFALYRTKKGRYILSRVGKSLVYHHATCPTVRRNGLDPLPSNVLSEDMVPCKNCRPSKDDELVYPELNRKWAQVSDTAEGVVESLKQYDNNGTEYLTKVSRNLLIAAARVDPGIHSAYYTEHIL